MWLDRINLGTVWAGLPTKLEVAVAARDPWRSWKFCWVPGCAPRPEVMIASLAVVDRLTVLHHDRDFDRISQVYGEPAVEWLVL